MNYIAAYWTKGLTHITKNGLSNEKSEASISFYIGCKREKCGVPKEANYFKDSPSETTFRLEKIMVVHEHDILPKVELITVYYYMLEILFELPLTSF